MQSKCIAVGFCSVGLYCICCFLQAFYHMPLGFEMPALSALYLGQSNWVEGQVTGFPVEVVSHTRGGRQRQHRFYVTVNQPHQDGALQLYVYWDEANSCIVPPQVGEQWRFKVRLRPFGGFQNPGLPHFGWTMAARHIGALAIVERAHLLKGAGGLSLFRQHIRDRVQQLPHVQGGAIISALVLGDKTLLAKETKAMVAKAGLSHLLAVSGMHVGMMAGFGFWVGGRLARLRIWRGDHDVVAWKMSLALVVALSYGLLTGFALPAQRACIALIVATFWRLYSGVVHWPASLLLSLVVVLLLSPLAPMSLDFWLSFGAIAVLMIAFQGQHQQARVMVHFFKAQLLLTMALMPSVMLMGGEFSFWSPLLNAVMIPVIGFIILPCAVVATALMLVNVHWPLLWVGWVLEQGISVLSLLMESHYNGVITLIVPPIQLFGFTCVLLSHLVPVYRPLRLVLVSLWLLCLLPNRPTHGDIWVDVLDVGQGTAILIRTANQNMIYDTGAQWQSGRNAAELVLLPYMKARGIDQLDLLFVSHEDNDHAGGVKTLVQELDIHRAMASYTQKNLIEPFEGVPLSQCIHPISWWWDGVLFTSFASLIRDSANNRSCLLKVDNGERALLIAGDVEFAAEQALLKNSQTPDLTADVLVVPHHGSRTSSSSGFINAINPTIAIVTARAPSPFRHPHSTVVARYQVRGIEMYNTGEQGAFLWR